MKVASRTADRSTPRPGGLLVAVGRDLVAATTILTRVPIGRSRLAAPFDATPSVDRAAGRVGAGAFGLVGAALGALIAAPVVLLGPSLPFLAAVLAIALLAVISGAIHLDGLADTADALLAPTRERAEAARTDPALGAGGAVALVLVLAVQVSALAAIVEAGGAFLAAATCVAAVAASRALAPVLVDWRSPTGIAGTLGRWFAGQVSGRSAAAGAVTAIVIAVLGGLVTDAGAIPAGVIGGGVLGLALGAALARLRGQVDGDLLGATIELGLAATLSATAIATTVAWPVR